MESLNICTLLTALPQRKQSIKNNELKCHLASKSVISTTKRPNRGRRWYLDVSLFFEPRGGSEQNVTSKEVQTSYCNLWKKFMVGNRVGKIWFFKIKFHKSIWNITFFKMCFSKYFKTVVPNLILPIFWYLFSKHFRCLYFMKVW